MMDAYDTTSKRMPNVSRGDDTVDQGDIRRVIGRFSPQLMNQLEQCIHAALDMQ